MNLHIITGLNLGGAEKALYRLMTSSNSKDDLVVSLTSKGSIGQELEEKGFKVFALGLRAYNFPIVLYRLYRLIKLHQPDIIQTWLYHADLLGGFAAKLAGVKHIIWGIRTTELKKGVYHCWHS